MNSWGMEWNGDGTFEISWDVFQDPQFHFQVFHIYWTESDLSSREKLAYRDFRAQAASNIGSDCFPDEENREYYKCPKCGDEV